MPTPKRADLVLSGGGVKGIGLVGAVAALVDAGYRPQRISGTSAGALVGAVLAAATADERVDAEELSALAMAIDYREFLDPGLIERIPVVGPAWGVVTGDGVYRGDALRDWVAREIAPHLTAGTLVISVAAGWSIFMVDMPSIFMPDMLP